MSILYNLLNKIGLNNNEIDSMININPELKSVDPELVFKNLVAVSDAGFPDDELSWLCYNNPKFLSLDNKQFKLKLVEVKSKNPDLEKALKNNPNLI